MESEETNDQTPVVPTSQKVLTAAGDVLVLAQAAFVVKKLVTAGLTAYRNR